METRILTQLLDRPGPRASVHVDTSGDIGAARQKRPRARSAIRRLTEQSADAHTRDAVTRHLALAHPLEDGSVTLVARVNSTGADIDHVSRVHGRDREGPAGDFGAVLRWAARDQEVSR